MEPKIDGHRLMIRVTANWGATGGKTVCCYSRGGKLRALPPAMHAEVAQLGPGLYDSELFVPGGMSSDVTRTDRVHDLRLAMFDVLEGFGTSLIHQPSDQRRSVLVKAVSSLPGAYVAVLPQFPVSKEGVEALWAAGEEGAVIKRIAATYQPGRRSSDWVKVKKAGVAVCTVVGYEAAKLGPYSCVKVTEDGADRQAFAVKTLNPDEMRALAANPESFIGRKLVVSYTERFPATQVMRHPMWDHWASAEEAAGNVTAPWAYVAK
jgi:uncharacterized protein YodC (DUF2158 family)